MRQCLPPNGYRLNDFPAIGVDQATGKLAVFWSDFRNGGPCASDPSTGLPVEPCANHNNDVFTSVSGDGGATWSAARLVPAGAAAQWQAWGDVGRDGALHVAYYDRKYGNCDASGCNDITLSKSADNGNTWTQRRITTSSMPNLTCKVSPTECTFLGDYMGLAIGGGKVHITWADTRGRNGTTEEDVYYSSVPSAP
jgi:hypothetical protein